MAEPDDEPKSISWNDIGRLSVGSDNRLYWDGKPLQTEQRLAKFERVLALIVSIAIIIGSLGALAQGVDAGHNFGCKFHWWSVGCQK